MHDEVENTLRCAKSFISKYGSRNLVLMGNVAHHLDEDCQILKLQGMISEPYIDPLLHMEKNSPNRHDWKPEEALGLVGIQLRNLALGFSKIQTSHTLCLHPDHLVREKLKNKHVTDYEMSNPNRYEPEFLNKLKTRYQISDFPHGYGIPGIMKKKAFYDAYTYFDKNQKIMKRLAEDSQNLVAYDDFLLPILFKLAGHRVENLNVTREIKRKTHFRAYFAPLLHQVR